MSKFIEYLNANPSIDWKTFLKVCAWNATPLKKLAPEVLTPIEATIDISDKLTQLNTDADNAFDAYQELDSLSPEAQTERRDTYYVAKKEEHYAQINKLESLMTVYGDLLADLCRFPAQSAQMKELKVFAIKELSSNMPNLAALANLPAEPTVASYIAEQRKELKTNFDKLSSEYSTMAKDNLLANEYIQAMLDELELAELEGEAKSQSLFN